MNRSHAIREWMKANPGPQSPMQVRLGLGLTREQANVALSEMGKAGILTFEGEPGKRVYSLARDLPPPLTPEQRKAHLAASRRKCRLARIADGRDEAYRRSIGIRPRAEYLASRKVAAIAKAEERAKQPKPQKQPKPPKARNSSAEFREKLHKSVQAKMSKLRHEPPAVFAKDDRSHDEMMAEFLARGGAIERLPPGAGTSLRFVGVDL